MNAFTHRPKALLQVFGVLMLLLMGQPGSLLAQRKPAPTEPVPAAPAALGPASPARGNSQEAVYRLALLYGDASMATQALYHRIVDQPQNLALRDTLMSLYYGLNQYNQALNVIKDLREKGYENLRTLEVEALAHRSLGQLKESLLSYEKLYQKTPQAFYLYQVVTLQYQLQRMGECTSSLAELIAKPEAAKEKVSVLVGQNQEQQVSILAAAHNVRGVLHLEQKRYSEARKDLEKARELEPDFVLAKNNLEALAKAEAPAPPPAPKR